MQPPPMQYAEVFLGLPLEQTFSYRLPASLWDRVRPGCLVWVPFRNRECMGVVLEMLPQPPKDQETKEILQVLEEAPLLGAKELAFYRWAAQYYFCPLGKVLRTALSPVFQGKASKGRSSMTQGLPVGSRHLQTVRLSPAGERFVATGESDAKTLGKRQREILEFLAREGERPVTALEQIIPAARGSVKGLERKGLLERQFQEVFLNPVELEEPPRSSPPVLTHHQAAAMAPVEKAISQEKFEAFVIYGVTSSGKTEMYLRATELSLGRAKQAIVLVPEISLTHQLVREFLARFGQRLAILHSRLSPGERAHMWKSILRSEVPIVLGARSALFAPCQSLGLIIVDEEHDGAYKQEEGFRYHARDLALMRAKLSGAVVLLGSATPSLETFSNARRGKLTWLELPERVHRRPLPATEIVDLRRYGRSREESRILSERLRVAMEETLGRGEQILLFLNRRGYATFLLCPECGYVFKCTNCSVTLVFHRSEKALGCHYCGWSRPAPALCPECQCMEVAELGMGTETLEEEVRMQFPEARVLRMDRDTTRPKHSQRDILRAWRHGAADILIGTQMVAKGHHVPNVTLVGVILADVSLNLPDFRASERSFQLLLQVAGRAGRGEQPGRVIIQTYHPQHPSVVFSATQDYLSFAAHELKAREEAGYPPFRHLVLFRISGPQDDHTARAAGVLGDVGHKLCQNRKGVHCLGPSPAPLSRLKGRHRWHLLLKGDSRPTLHALARHLRELAVRRITPKSIRLSVDVDPQSFL